jgi:hypothetical protein
MAPRTINNPNGFDGKTQMLLRKEDVRALPALYATEDNPDPTVHVHLFCPYSRAHWYLTEYDPAKDLAFGLADLGEPELGYIAIHELRALAFKVMGGRIQAVERDVSWRPCPLSEVRNARR